MPGLKKVTEEQRKALGERIRAYRRYRGLTAEELAGLVGCSKPVITCYERGKAYPPDSVILAIADALHVRAVDLERRKYCTVPKTYYGSVKWELATRDWRGCTVDEIAAELGVSSKTVYGAAYRLRNLGYQPAYTGRQRATGARLEPPPAPSKQVDSKQCKSCRYHNGHGYCDYLTIAGKRRPVAKDGICPAREMKRGRRAAWR